MTSVIHADRVIPTAAVITAVIHVTHAILVITSNHVLRTDRHVHSQEDKCRRLSVILLEAFYFFIQKSF